MKSFNVLCTIGTRPEAIKMAPIIHILNSCEGIKCRVLVTAQHRELLDQVLNCFDINPDIDLNLMSKDQSLTILTGRLLISMDKVLNSEKPDLVLVQGDTTTAMTVSLACFYHSISVGHVEAGLRTWNMQYPFPEEANRVIVGKLARWHFSPTERSRQNLLQEGVLDKDIIVTGNTVIDALLLTAAKNLENPFQLDPKKRLVLVTSHRRENFGRPLHEICKALGKLAKLNPMVQFIYPVHPNPNIRNFVYQSLAGFSNFTLCEPLDYEPFVSLMKQSYIILTDSGGVQEEAPALGKPVLVMRNETERPEAVEQGVVKLVGFKAENIICETQKLLDDKNKYKEMARGVSPYGDGNAAKRIVKHIKQVLAG